MLSSLCRMDDARCSVQEAEQKIMTIQKNEMIFLFNRSLPFPKKQPCLKISTKAALFLCYKKFPKSAPLSSRELSEFTASASMRSAGRRGMRT